MVNSIIGVLKSIFKYAEKTYNICNISSNVVMPKKCRKKIDVLSNCELKKIKKYCEENEKYFSVVFDLCISTGIRIGELCALQCGDIDMKNKIMHIRKTAQRIRTTDTSAKTTVVVGEPKTENSAREIPLPKEIIPKLKSQMTNKSEKDFLFSTKVGKGIDVRSIQKKFSTVLKKCNVRHVNFHILRHTFATRWINSNFDVKSLSEILGHSNISTTLSLYVHPSENIKRKNIDSLYL